MLGLAYCHSFGIVHRDLKFANCARSSTSRRIQEVFPEVVQTFPRPLRRLQTEQSYTLKGHDRITPEVEVLRQLRAMRA